MPRGVPKNGFRNTKKRMAEGNSPVAVPQVIEYNSETDEEIFRKLETRFNILELMTEAACANQINSMIVSGPAGLGKSFTIEQVISQHCGMTKFVKGFTRATNLYKTLYEFRHKGSVVVFDDCDSAFMDTDCLNILKAAVDSCDRRVITWGSETTMVTEDGTKMPTSFEFEGSVIFITNYDFDQAIDRNHRLAPHFEALISRSHYIDLEMKSRRDYIIRIKQVVGAGMLSNRGFSASEIQEILTFIDKNSTKLRELSLRMVSKIADLYRMNDNWENIATVTLLKK